MLDENAIIKFGGNKAELEREHKLISLALENLEKEYKFTRLNPYDFESTQPGYSKEEIDQDFEALKNKRKKYLELTLEQKNLKLKADFLERLIVVGISNFEWFGKNVEGFLTSEIDDEINHIDGGTKFKVPKHITIHRMFGFDFDATFTSDIEGIYTKIHALKSDLDKNNVPNIKYVHDENGDKNGVSLPKVVLGCDNESLNILIKEISEKNFDFLEKNSIQYKLLIQAEVQLTAFKERYGKKSAYYKAQALNEKDPEKQQDLKLEQGLASRLFDMHSGILGLIEKASREKNLNPETEEFFSDAVHVKILDAAKKINKQKK